MVRDEFNFTDGYSSRYWTGNSTNDRNYTYIIRDTSAWYHIVLAVDTTESTAADRRKFM